MPSAHRPSQEILTAPQFHRSVRLERQRTDRGGPPFAVAVFPADQASAHRLAQVSPRRLRGFDQVGWYGQDQLGVLLPQTAPRSASSLAEDLLELAGLPAVYRVLAYPPEAAPGGMAEIQGYLALPTPLWKRCLDLFCAVVGLIVLTPLFIVVGAYIELVSPGPVLFRQTRVGRGGRTFSCYKFRTMRVCSDGSLHRDYTARQMRSKAPMRKLDGADPRIIPGARFMRKVGIDELPQLFNILRGEMSLVGPRPCIPYELAEYEPWHAGRLDVLPGLTGLWQVSGKNNLSFETMVRLDLAYAASVTVLGDLEILLKTFPTLVGLALAGPETGQGLKGVRA